VSSVSTRAVVAMSPVFRWLFVFSSGTGTYDGRIQIKTPFSDRVRPISFPLTIYNRTAAEPSVSDQSSYPTGWLDNRGTFATVITRKWTKLKGGDKYRYLYVCV